MCNFFSCVVVNLDTAGFGYWFTEGDSHEAIIRRAGLRDDQYWDKFVRVECDTDVSIAPVYLDEQDPPQWYLDNVEEIKQNVRALALRIAPFHYAIKDTVKEAWDEFDETYQELKARYPELPHSVFHGLPELEKAAEYRTKKTRASYDRMFEFVRTIEGYIPE
jgi:hypothetical protein